MDIYRIAVSDGDTVGEELVRQVYKVFRALERGGNAAFQLEQITACGPAIEQYGVPFPEKELERATSCRALLFGNIGSQRYSSLPAEQRPERALLAARKAFGVCTNLRPAKIFPGMESFSPLKAEITQKGFDMFAVRDLMGGMIPGKKERGEGPYGREASDLEYYHEQMVEINARWAFQIARSRRGKVTSLDKSNVLYSSALWREKVGEVARQYPDVTLRNTLIDAAAMEVISNPADFDVILTSNMFGDILSDEIAQLTGTPWMFGSAELAGDGRGIYTPNQLHHPRGDAFAGKGIVCPYGILNATAMLLRYSCDRPDLAMRVENAIDCALREKLSTEEMNMSEGCILSTDELGDAIASFI